MIRGFRLLFPHCAAAAELFFDLWARRSTPSKSPFLTGLSPTQGTLSYDVHTVGRGRKYLNLRIFSMKKSDILPRYLKI